MSSGLYNEGLFREGLLRTTNLVRPGLITQFDTLEEALTRFAVNSVEAALALDFIGNEYRTGNTETTFAAAFTGNSPKLTYDPGSASSSQSTMTQGYGPELVTDFSTYADQAAFDVDWTRGAGWTFDANNDTADCDGTQVGNTAINAAASVPVTAGSVYQISFDLTVSSGFITWVAIGDTLDGTNLTTSGRYETTLVAATSGPFNVAGDANFVGSIDNISVREAPKIVWAPHNLVDYSEDFSWWTASNGTLTNTDVLTPVSPDGSFTADEFTSSSAYGNVQRTVASLKVGVSYTFSAWVQKGTATNEWSIYDASNAVVLDTTTSASNGAWEKLQGTFTADNNLKVLRLQDRTGVASTGTVYIYGAHVYRSDLGGMASVPQSATGFETYVPTNGNEVYLPRVGHHVYNGSAWVNEGLLIESEPRTNLATYSEANQTNWPAYGAATVTDLSENALGVFSGISVASGGQTWHASSPADISLTASQVYSLTVWYAAGTSGELYVAVKDVTTANEVRAKGIIGSLAISGPGGSMSILSDEELGGGVRRLSVTVTPNNTGSHELIVGPNSAASGQTVKVYGAQLEAGATPSSYIPTSGSTVTRGGQSLTVPANWYDVDNPTYTGPELVTNGTFDADTSGWTSGNSAALSVVSTQLRISNSAASNGFAVQSISTEQGKTYLISATVTAGSHNGRLGAGTAQGTPFNIATSPFGTGLQTLTFTAQGATTYIGLQTEGASIGNTTDFDNISVRQVSAPQFGWPEPEYIGPELLSGTWASASGYDNTTTGSGTSVSAISGTTVSRSYLNITGATVGSVMRLVASCDSASTGGLQIYAREGLSPNAGTVIASETDAVLGSQSAELVFTVTTSNLTVLLQSSAAGADFAATVSVREINPLSVSIQMDGRMTYADTDVVTEAVPWDWDAGGTNRIFTRLNTAGGTGKMSWIQGAAYEETGGSQFSPGINVPFNIASRHGSTFIDAAVDGVALTGGTTPTALPDLSGTDLQIAYDFMGTIGTFRQFAGDIGDTGLVTATNPSTEPTLSLTFDGTASGSFYNLNWSE